MKRFLSLNRIGLVATLLLVDTASALHAQTLTTFDVPNSTSLNPAAINSAGQIVGWYTGGSTDHGFLREPEGTITTFDVPGSTYTHATAVNPAGQVSGYSYGPIHQQGQNEWDIIRGFVRQPDGSIELFDPCLLVSGGGAPTENSTYPQSINPTGDIAGLCHQDADIDSYEYGFLRQSDGTVVWIAIPYLSKYGWTKPRAINPRGQITGTLSYGPGSKPGFLVQPDGTFITFTADGSSDLHHITFTQPQAINPAGQITGSYLDEDINIYDAFLRQPNGTIIRFNIGGSIATAPQAISPAGEIAGVYLDYQFHGFLREKKGNVTNFDVPNSTDTYPTSISSSGQIAGWYSDASGVHGFVRDK